MMKFFSWLLIIIGICCYLVGGYYLWIRNDPNRLAFKNYHYSTAANVKTKLLPVRITIQSLHIDLPVFPAEIRNDVWQTTNDGASYLVSSPLPGTTGNSIIYAHDFASLFGNLSSAKQGDSIIIQFADKSHKKFTVISTKIVTPEDASILAPSKTSELTLYTCTGWFDSKRFVVVASLGK